MILFKNIVIFILKFAQIKMLKSYKHTLEIRQWLQGITIKSCSPIVSALYCNSVPAFEHGLEDYNDNKKGCKGQRKKKIIKRAA